MRFLLVLLAIVSGLSFAHVAVAASPCEVVARAQPVAAAVAPAASAGLARARAICVPDTRPGPNRAPVEPGFARPCGVTIADQPHE